MSSSTLSLIQSAFGISSTLYTVLQCNKSSTSIQLKKSYRKAALKYHPDRCVESSNNDCDTASSTLKFQAVSAAYQVLSNDKRRSVYDSTGQIIDDEDEHYTSHTNNNDSPNNNTHQQQQWEEFFTSIFNEIITTGSNHAVSASSFRGSKEEQRDVLHYYTMCKGDMNKVVECIIHGSIDDVNRYMNDIIEPAVVRGDVEDYSGIRDNLKKVQKKKRRRILEDSSSEDEQPIATTNKIIKSRRKPKHNSLLIDTDDESDSASSPKKQPSGVTDNNNMSMSKKDKMEFRVVKKRKGKAEKEMEISSIINSKNWDASSAFHHASSQQQQGRKKKKNMGDLSDALLDNIEKKYGGNSKKKTKKRR